MELNDIVTHNGNGRYEIIARVENSRTKFVIRDIDRGKGWSDIYMAFQGDSIYWVEVEKVVPNPFQPRREFDQNKLQELREAVAREDRRGYVRHDIELHRLIWGQANNPYLLDLLRTLTGPIYMFVADNANVIGWDRAFELHEKLIDSINAGDVRLALEQVDCHMDEGLYRSNQVFQRRELL